MRDRRRHQPTSAATARRVDLLGRVRQVDQEVTIALDQLAGVDPALEEIGEDLPSRAFSAISADTVRNFKPST